MVIHAKYHSSSTTLTYVTVYVGQIAGNGRHLNVNRYKVKIVVATVLFITFWLIMCVLMVSKYHTHSLCTVSTKFNKLCVQLTPAALSWGFIVLQQKFWQILIWWLLKQTTKLPNFPSIQQPNLFILNYGLKWYSSSPNVCICYRLTLRYNQYPIEHEYQNFKFSSS